MWRWALVLLVLARSAAAAPPQLALVVSISAYQNLPALPACQASAAIVTASLKRAGWAVAVLRDPSNGQLGAGLDGFADALAKAPDAAALVYACGYATAFEGRLFLLPASARLVRETDALTEGVVLPALTGVMSRTELRAGLVVADLVALPGKPPVPPEAAQRRRPGPRTGLLVISAPADGPDSPTPAAAALAAALAEPNLSIRQAQSITMDGVTARDTRTFVEPPDNDAWLVGSPPPPPPSPLAASVPAAPPVAGEPPPPSTPEAPPAPTPVATAVNAPASLGELDRRRAQLALQHLGYYAGRVDGTFGPESLAAIRRYQHELGAEMSGRLTEEQANRLLATP